MKTPNTGQNIEPFDWPKKSPPIKSITETLFEELDVRAVKQEIINKRRFRKVFWIALASLLIMIATLAVMLWPIKQVQQKTQPYKQPSPNQPDSFLSK